MGRKRKDYTGQKFGRLEAVEFSHRKNAMTYWLFECDCGNEIIKRVCIVTSGNVKSCGCIRKANLKGQKFGKLLVNNLNPIQGNDGKHRRGWLCKCECGNEKAILEASLKSGKTRSCGCYDLERRRTHGLSYSKIYATWVGMKQRCYNTKCKDFKTYGGRGIIVCERWKESFVNFYEDMGERPNDNMSIDRIENDGNYEPSNCKWSTSKEQSNNRRCSKKNKK